jgi:hypothetical protein
VLRTDPRAVAATATRTQLDAVLASCAADQACSASFPDAATSLDTALASLAARPVTLQMDDPAAPGRIPVLYDDAMLLRTCEPCSPTAAAAAP